MLGTSIRDPEFFPELPAVLSDVGGRLSRLTRLVEEMQAASEAAAEATSAAGKQRLGAAAMGGSSDNRVLGSLGETEASQAGVPGSLRGPSKRLQWADGQALPAAEQAAAGEAEGGSDAEGEADAAAAAAAVGEKALRKGFRRRTWAGPAWLNAVSGGKVGN